MKGERYKQTQLQRHLGTYHTPLEELSRWCEAKGEMSAGRLNSGAQQLDAKPGEFISVNGTDGSHGKQMEFVLHIVRQHSGLLGRKWPSSIFRTMVYKSSGFKAYAPRVKSSLALSEPFKVHQQWGMNDQRRLRRLVDKKEAAWVKKAVDKGMPDDSRV